MYYEGARDFYRFFSYIYFTAPEKEVLEEAQNKGLPRYMPAFERLLKDSGTGFLVGSSVTLADLALLEVLLLIEEYFGAAAFNDYPSLKTFFEAMKKDPKIAAFLKGPHRKGKNTPEYAANVVRVLATK